MGLGVLCFVWFRGFWGLLLAVSRGFGLVQGFRVNQ